MDTQLTNLQQLCDAAMSMDTKMFQESFQQLVEFCATKNVSEDKLSSLYWLSKTLPVKSWYRNKWKMLNLKGIRRTHNNLTSKIFNEMWNDLPRCWRERWTQRRQPQTHKMSHRPGASSWEGDKQEKDRRGISRRDQWTRWMISVVVFEPSATNENILLTYHSWIMCLDSPRV